MNRCLLCAAEIAGLPLPQNLSGYSLLPLSSETPRNNGRCKPLRPPWILSEFHGCNVNASTYMLRTNQWKYIAYADGVAVLPQLFGKWVHLVLSVMLCAMSSLAWPYSSYPRAYLLLFMLGKGLLTVARMSS